MVGSARKGGEKEKSKADKKEKKEKAEGGSEAWWTKNPSTESAWKVPDGKSYGDYFNPSKPETKENSVGWPKVPHHKDPSKERYLCLKYQVKGACNAGCRLSHVIPSKLGGDVKAEVDARIKSIYS